VGCKDRSFMRATWCTEVRQGPLDHIQTNFWNRESSAVREVNEVFTVLVFAVASVGLGPPPPKKLLMSDGMAGASNRDSGCTEG
jgi:hypothetical protein